MKSNRTLSKPLINFVVLALTLSFGPAVVSQDDSGLSSREALKMISDRYGEASVEWIVELRGKGGVPQPKGWSLLAYDEKAPRLLAWFQVDRRKAVDDGLDDELYPKNPPAGYLNLKDLRVDSKAAFTIAEGQASNARMGFDELNYSLKVREYSREPIWLVELVDANGMLVGKVFLSGKDGEVLRTVWIYRGDQARPDGLPLIIDSAVPRTEVTRIRSSRNQTPSENSNSIRISDADSNRTIPLLPLTTEPSNPRKIQPMERDASRDIPAGEKPAVAPSNPIPEPEPTDRLRDMRRPAPKLSGADNPIFKKPATGTPDTRIPPPPIPPR